MKGWDHGAKEGLAKLALITRISVHSNYCVTHTSSITNRHGGQLLRVNCGRHAETSDSGATQFNIVRFL